MSGSAFLLLFLVFTSSHAQDVCDFSSTYPRQYVTYFTNTPPVIDGNLDEPVWNDVAWTESFMDISGPAYPPPPFNSKGKVRWDNNWLYVAVAMQETDLWATLTQHNSIIFYDNDIELFVNPDGSNHYYKEYEMNQFNANWDICMNKPYSNGGYENSSRVFGAQGWDMPNQKSAVMLNGTINYPYDVDNWWTTEMAFPLSDLAYNNSVTLPPPHNSYWRFEFARVEYHVKVVNGQYQKVGSAENWVWAPTYQVNLHMPEYYGYLQFSTDKVNNTQPIQDPDWTVRYLAMQLYYAQTSFYNAKGTYTNSISDLTPFAPPNTLNGTCTLLPVIVTYNKGQNYNASLTSLDKVRTAHIQDDRYLIVTY